jgi:hypothetical protein
MAFRIFVAAVSAALCWAAGALGLWLLAQLELPAVLQRHHPLLLPLAPLLRQTETLFVTALALSGAIWGASLPAPPLDERKWRELEAVAATLAALWAVLASLIALAAALETPAVWFFALLAALVAAAARGCTKAIGALARRAQRRSMADPAPDPAADPAAEPRVGQPVEQPVEQPAVAASSAEPTGAVAAAQQATLR